MIKLIRKYQFPKYLRHFKELKGICIGGCVDKTDINEDHFAHAHPKGGINQGWICLRYKYQLKMKLLMLHEMAHLLVYTWNTPHGLEWREALLAIGGTYKPFTYKRNGIWYINLDYTHRPQKR